MRFIYNIWFAVRLRIPEVEFQYGRRLFFRIRSRYISAINLYMLTIEVDEIWFVDKF